MLKFKMSKMAGKSKFLFLVLFGVVVSINLSAFVSSRIEGVVVDKETGKPIEGAEVILCKGDIKDYRMSNTMTSAYTDSEGKFKINLVAKRGYRYFIIVVKKGYATYGHVYDLKKATTNDFPGANFWNIIGPKDESRWFTIKEGNIKYFRIGMEKEAILEINISYKYPPEIEPVKPIPHAEEYTHDIIIKHEKYEQEGEYHAWKNKIIKGLAPGKVEVTIYTLLIGWPLSKSKRIIELKSGKNVLNWVFDLTKGGALVKKVVYETKKLST